MRSSTFSSSRRAWLRSLLPGLVIAPALASGADDLKPIRARGKEADLAPFEVVESDGFRGIGDAPAGFQEEALTICEAVSADYRRHFLDKGFDLNRPADKLTVVILAGTRSYAAFEKVPIGEVIGGHFDLEANWLVIFDAREGGPRVGAGVAVPEADNTLKLVHETIHQLTFNTGVLDLKADVPLCVSEGLATYGETWRPGRKAEIGSVNFRRRRGLEDGAKEGVKWIPLARLLADDGPFDDEKEQQVAYAECWMFASKMLKDRARLPKFRDYLAALRGNDDPKKRIELATTHLGDLARLDREIRRPS